ncbi:Glycosyl hydrolases family 16 [Pseudovibrio sp. W64]|uniref:glycoside hydrolase family 16 protein n=1 Tax=Pseudovibrio sp. W64 TaxID=1735583 RepID=UPI0007AE61CE|nr:glycoside hydrolase family 16 protein [Pseudovibrio sp. W64]KZK90786.1 Glycosyl hydrolases family 16 [Pseudovibrio sp. W64]
MVLQSNSKLIFEDNFDGPALDINKWLPNYLPHWSSLELSAASYEIKDKMLRLFISENQQCWSPEFDGENKVSGIQTGHFAGPLNSPHGQHRFRDGLSVKSEVPEMQLFLPQYCRLDIRVRAKLKPWNLAALWLIGFEDQPDHSGEITVFEIFGRSATANEAQVGRGIKRINDPLLKDEFDDSILPLDVTDWHVYSKDWSPSQIDFFADGELVTTTSQSPNYPMQLMLNFYEFPHRAPKTPEQDAWMEVDFIRCFAQSE